MMTTVVFACSCAGWADQWPRINAMAHGVDGMKAWWNCPWCGGRLRPSRDRLRAEIMTELHVNYRTAEAILCAPSAVQGYPTWTDETCERIERQLIQSGERLTPGGAAKTVEIRVPISEELMQRYEALSESDRAVVLAHLRSQSNAAVQNLFAQTPPPTPSVDLAPIGG